MPRTFAPGELLTAQLVNDELNPTTAPHVAAKVAAGKVTVSVSAGAAVATANVTFPAGRFDVAPLVQTTLQAATGGTGKWVARAYNVTTTGCVVALYTGDGSTFTAAGSIDAAWLAVQMTPAAAAG